MTNFFSIVRKRFLSSRALTIIAAFAVIELAIHFVLFRIAPGAPWAPFADSLLLLLLAVIPSYVWIVSERASRAEAFERLERNADEQAALNRLLGIANKSASYQELFEEILERLFGIAWLSIDSKGAVFVIDTLTQKLVLTAHRNLPEVICQSCATVPMGECFCGAVAKSGLPKFAESASHVHRRKFPEIAPHAHYGLPITIEGKPVGVLVVYLKPEHPYREREFRFLESVAAVLAGIIQRMKVAERVQQSQQLQLLGNLAGGVAHDFNNILTAILSGCCYLKSEISEGSAARLEVDQIEGAARRAAGLTAQLLAMSHHKASNRAALDLNEVVSEMSGMLSRVIGDNIQFRTLLFGSPCTVVEQTTRLQQVILNFVVNARDAMPRGGRLTVATAIEKTGDSERVVLSVQDTGTGITDEDKRRIFEPFFTTKPMGRGTGLGLATCLAIVTQGGGEITVESEAGHGSMFKAYFPRHHGPGDALRQTPVSFRAGHERILLVEDDAASRVSLAANLRNAGYAVVESNSAEQALDVLEREEAPALVISDVMLPGMSGYQFAARIRSRHAGMRFLFISGYSDQEYPFEKHPHFRYLQKPFSFPDLAHALREVLSASDKL